MKRSSCKDGFPYEVINPLIPHMQIRLYLLKKIFKFLKFVCEGKLRGDGTALLLTNCGH